MAQDDNNRAAAARDIGETSGAFGRESDRDDTGSDLRSSPRQDDFASDVNAPQRFGSPPDTQWQQASQRTVDFKPPRPPMFDAPARFGTAGISAGEDRLYKTDLTDTPDPRRGEPPDVLAQSLGWFSIGLGLLEVVNAEGLARWLGTDNRTVIRAYGFREIGNGIALLSQKDSQSRSPWLWTRVAGDGLDLYSLKKLHTDDNPNRGNVKLAIVAVAGVMMLDVMAAGLLAEK